MNRSPFVVLIGAVLVIAILVLGWFGLVAPQIATASANSAQAAAVEQGNTEKSLALQQFATQNKQLPALRKKLARLQEAIPATSQLDVFLGELNSLASSTGVTIDGVTPGEALPYSSSTSTSTSTSTTTGSSATSTATPTPVPTAPTTTTPATTTPTTSATGLYTIAVTITVAGTQSQVVAFSKALQSGSRLFLLTTMSFQGSGIGLPASGSLSGYIFVAPDATASTGSGTGTTSTATPTPSVTPTSTATSTPTATPTPTKKP